MLDVAQKYTNELKLKFVDTSYDLKYQYYHGGWSSEYKPNKDNWNNFEFVSIDKNSNILGHISYNIRRNSNMVDKLCIINFSDNKIQFGRDLAQAIDDIFIKYNFRKLEYGVFIGNPIEKTYDKFTKMYGGSIVGVKHKTSRLLDGKLYDFKMYELFRENYITNKTKER